MDYASLPHFCRREGSGSSRYSSNSTGDDDCFSLDHSFHQELYKYINQQAESMELPAPIKHRSFHVDFPEPNQDDRKIAETIESECQKLTDQNGMANKLDDLTIKEDGERKWKKFTIYIYTT